MNIGGDSNCHFFTKFEIGKIPGISNLLKNSWDRSDTLKNRENTVQFKGTPSEPREWRNIDPCIFIFIINSLLTKNFDKLQEYRWWERLLSEHFLAPDILYIPSKKNKKSISLNCMYWPPCNMSCYFRSWQLGTKYITMNFRFSGGGDGAILLEIEFSFYSYFFTILTTFLVGWFDPIIECYANSQMSIDIQSNEISFVFQSLKLSYTI